MIWEFWLWPRCFWVVARRQAAKIHRSFATSCRFHHLDSVPRILLRNQKIGPTRRPETSVGFNQLTRRNSPQEPASTQLLQTKQRVSKNVLRKLYMWVELNFHWHTPHYTGRNSLLPFPNWRDYTRLYITVRIHPKLPPLCIIQLL
jgi:hypothetical protein